MSSKQIVLDKIFTQFQECRIMWLGWTYTQTSTWLIILNISKWLLRLISIKPTIKSTSKLVCKRQFIAFPSAWRRTKRKKLETNILNIYEQNTKNLAISRHCVTNGVHQIHKKTYIHYLETLQSIQSYLSKRGATNKTV